MGKLKWKKENTLFESAGQELVYAIGKYITKKKFLLTIAHKNGSVETLIWTKRLKTAKLIAELIESET